ncbi:MULTISPECIES: type II toxin-antitoxin system RelE/ParE family toxin [unclassified Sulfitobacter]|uniref:type II toxin-antitoxin system RelE/ParE family toxin n=1 Tax=unclassified Sulfitobacter TaxID=196795 RepID=UPI0037472508
MGAEGGWQLRPAARSDLADIWRYGATTWGADQADRYADGLFAVFDLLAAFPKWRGCVTPLIPRSGYMRRGRIW